MALIKKKSFPTDLLYVALLLVFSILISLPLFKGEFFSGYDYGGTLMRLLSMQLCFGHGQWAVRWVPYMYYGYGYPLFNFYPPLFYVLGTLIANLGANIIIAVNMSLFIVLFLSGGAMYLFARELWGKEGGFVSATAYIFAPYHIVDLYVRAAAAETAAFVFLPLILWSFYKLKQTAHKRYVLFSALSCAGLLLTHNGISIIFFPVVLAYIFYLHWPDFSRGKSKSLLRSFQGLGLGLGLSAFFWLPAFVEKKFVQIQVLTQGNEDFHKNFLSFKQLLSPVWGYNLLHDAEPHMSCQVGLVHLLASVIVLLGLKKIAGQGRCLRDQILFFSLVLAGAVYFTLPYSMFIWEHIKILQFLQFPLRFLTIVVLALSVMTGGIVLLAPPKNRIAASLVVGLIIFGANFSYCHPRELVNIDLSLINADPQKYLSMLCLQDGGDYIPIGVKGGVKGLPSFMPAEKLSALRAGQVFDINKISPLRYSSKVQAGAQALFCFYAFYFPGWMVTVDGNPIDILKDNPFGLIIFPCPEGIHEVEIYFGTTPVRQIAQGITMISLILLVLTLIILK